MDTTFISDVIELLNDRLDTYQGSLLFPRALEVIAKYHKRATLTTCCVDTIQVDPVKTAIKRVSTRNSEDIAKSGLEENKDDF